MPRIAWALRFVSSHRHHAQTTELLSNGSLVRIQPGTPAKLEGQLLDKNDRFRHRLTVNHSLSCQCKEYELSTLSDALTAYRICAQAEGRSPRTIQWITSSIRYFAEFLGGDQDISTITANDLRRFIIGLQGAKKYRNHPLQ